MTKMNGARATERVREDREKILSLRKVFVSGPLYTTLEVGLVSLGDVERLRYRVDTAGSWGLNLPKWGKPRLHGREICNSERCMEERPERTGRQAPGPGVRNGDGASGIKINTLLPARFELAIFG